MKNFSQKELEQDSLIKAQILVYIDDKDQVAFGSDWEDSDDGINAVSEILFKLKYEDMVEQMLMVLYKQCVIEERTEVFNEILKNIHSKILENKKPDDIVFRPTAQGDRYV